MNRTGNERDKMFTGYLQKTIQLTLMLRIKCVYKCKYFHFLDF